MRLQPCGAAQGLIAIFSILCIYAHHIISEAMQRPNGNRDIGRSRGRGRGRGRGSLGNRRVDTREPPNVPKINQVVPGGCVSIVLKVDQPTGAEVQGVVADVLTSGNHPRGIKVRLVDGRVGRVQRMVTEEEARSGSQGLAGLGRNGETSNENSTGNSGRARYRDVRGEEDMSIPSSGYSLADFLPQNHPLMGSAPAEIPSAAPIKSATQVCPVCNEFEGDEIAVTHHTNSHFE
jgi:uncharacterized repeat protein (TIGR03833 family)